jgi:hypothetical protein
MGNQQPSLLQKAMDEFNDKLIQVLSTPFPEKEAKIKHGEEQTFFSLVQPPKIYEYRTFNSYS